MEGSKRAIWRIFVEKNRSIGCREGQGRLTVEAGWPVSSEIPFNVAVKFYIEHQLSSAETDL